MIGFLKRWFATKSEVESIEKRLDDLAYGIQQMHRKLILKQDVDVEQWRPKGYILNGGKPVNGVHAITVDVTNKPMTAKLSPDAKKAYDAWRAKNVSPLAVATPLVVDEPDEPKRKPPYMPWVESVVSMEHTIRNKMSQLCGSSENFIRLCRKKDCHVLVSKTTRVMLDQSGKTDKLREYPHGYIEMRHKRKRTSAGNPMRKYYTFETPQGYENAKKALEQMKCPYTTGKTK